MAIPFKKMTPVHSLGNQEHATRDAERKSDPISLEEMETYQSKLKDAALHRFLHMLTEYLLNSGYPRSLGPLIGTLMLVALDADNRQFDLYGHAMVNQLLRHLSD